MGGPGKSSQEMTSELSFKGATERELKEKTANIKYHTLRVTRVRRHSTLEACDY